MKWDLTLHVGEVRKWLLSVATPPPTEIEVGAGPLVTHQGLRYLSSQPARRLFSNISATVRFQSVSEAELAEGGSTVDYSVFLVSGL